MVTTIRCGFLLLPDRVERDVYLTIDGGRILDVAHTVASSDTAGNTYIDASEHVVAPGFIDIHVHGAMAADTMDASVKSLRTMARFFAQRGVTGFLPTTMTASGDEIASALRAVKRVMREGPHLEAQRSSHTRSVGKHPLPSFDYRSGGGGMSEARILGAHVEGPFVNPERCGAQAPEFMRPADRREYVPWFDAGVVKLITVAPEMSGVMDLIRQAQQRGIAVAIGHTDATYEQAQAAFAEGANQCTHTFNAMRGLHQREPGALGAVMANPDVYAQLIADNVHVHPGAMAALYQCKHADRLAVITDAMEATGEGDGEYTLGAHRVLVRDGVARLENGSLAGSTLTMDAAFRNIIAATGCTLVEASRMCSHTPACAIGLGERKGLIAPGYDADLVILDQQLRVAQTLVSGQQIA